MVMKSPHLGNLFEQALAAETYTAGLTLNGIVAGNRFRFLIANPVGSRRLVAIYNVVLQSRTDEFFTLRLNPTVVPTTPLTSGNRFVGAPNGIGQAFGDSSATPISGGVALSYGIAVTNNARNEIDLEAPFVLPPGASISAELHNSSGAATDVSFVIAWIEPPI